MVRITMLKDKKKEWVGFLCEGHVGYASHGKDIVCAAVSILAINTINSIEQLAGDPYSFSENKEKGVLRFHVIGSSSKETQLLLSSFRLGIEAISDEYGSKFLRLKDKEV